MIYNKAKVIIVYSLWSRSKKSNFKSVWANIASVLPKERRKGNSVSFPGILRCWEMSSIIQNSCVETCPIAIKLWRISMHMCEYVYIRWTQFLSPGNCKSCLSHLRSLTLSYCSYKRNIKTPSALLTGRFEGWKENMMWKCCKKMFNLLRSGRTCIVCRVEMQWK